MDTPPARARISEHGLEDGLTVLSYARDDKPGRFKRRSRERGAVGGHDGCDVCGTSRDGSELGSKSRWKGAGVVLRKDACNREKRIAQIRLEQAGELVTTIQSTPRGGCIVQTQAQYGGRVGQINT